MTATIHPGAFAAIIKRSLQKTSPLNCRGLFFIYTNVRITHFMRRRWGVTSGRTDPEFFYERLRHSGVEVRDILWPLASLNPRERAVFTEYHYWKTHMKLIAQSHRISLGRAYEVLYKAEEKIAASRSQEEEANA